MKRSRFDPSGVTPPPIISAMLPVTTTPGMLVSPTRFACLRLSSVPFIDRWSSESPVTETGSSCGGSASV